MRPYLANVRRWRSKRLGVLLLVCLVLQLFAWPLESVYADDGGGCPIGMSKLDCQAIFGNYANWIPDSSDGDNSCTTETLTTSAANSDNPQTVYNFFRAAGLDDMHAAAVWGNLKQESGFDPTIMQKGGNSQNPADAGDLGYGLAQWSPGGKLTGIAAGYGITDPIYLLTTQLAIILKEMHDVSPAGVNDTFDGIKQQTTIEDATNYFMNEFEAAGTPGPRIDRANEGLKTYGGQDFTTVSSDGTGGCSSPSLSPDCQSASGTAKILCAAKIYDTVSYSETVDGGHQGGKAWHDSCPVVGASCILDCSGLVNIAIYDAFGVDLQENTGGERSDNKNWQSISFDQLQPGDLIQPGKYGGGHVEIVDHVSGNTIYTFGAHTHNVPQPDQVGPDSYTRSDGDLYLHFTGSGS